LPVARKEILSILRREEPPPAFGHPLVEGDTPILNSLHFIPLSEGVAEGRGRLQSCKSRVS